MISHKLLVYLHIHQSWGTNVNLTLQAKGEVHRATGFLDFRTKGMFKPCITFQKTVATMPDTLSSTLLWWNGCVLTTEINRSLQFMYTELK